MGLGAERIFFALGLTHADLRVSDSPLRVIEHMLYLLFCLLDGTDVCICIDIRSTLNAGFLALRSLQFALCIGHITLSDVDHLFDFTLSRSESLQLRANLLGLALQVVCMSTMLSRSAH
jgi:hypothetical protein